MSVRAVHHLNAGTMCPPARRVMAIGDLVCHCLVVVTERDGLIVVDTGFSTLDTQSPSRIPWASRRLMRPTLAPAEPVKVQLAALGFSPDDVRHVVVTHLDLDHAGGLIDFPRAVVHVHQREHAAAMQRATLGERMRYLPRQWAHDVRWQLVAEAGDVWRGIAGFSPLRGVDADVALVPLFGHTRGHSGVAIRTRDGWLLHAGDAYLHRRRIEPDRGAQPWGLAVYERAIRIDRKAELASVLALQLLHASHSDVQIFCSHDRAELALFATKTS